MKKINHLLTILWGASSTEISGFRLLVITALLCAVGLYLANYLSFSPYSNYLEDSRKLDSLLLLMDDNDFTGTIKNSPSKLEAFDPNLASEQELITYGFPLWLATRLVNYRSTGARFYKPVDLLKLYGFPDSLYFRIKDSIQIANKPKIKKTGDVLEKPRVSKKYEHKVLPVFDLNSADTSVLKTIKGVGSKLSARIIKYRNALGGFIAMSQLHQVYGLDSLVIKNISDHSVINTGFIPAKININEATKEQLAAHPYINWTEAKLIIAYRNQHGHFKDMNDIAKVYSIDTSWVKKNAPYLSF